MPTLNTSKPHAVCLLSLGGDAYSEATIRKLANWQRRVGLPIQFIILDGPETVNCRVLGVASRPEAYFQNVIAAQFWSRTVEVVRYSDFESAGDLDNDLASMKAAVAGDHKLRNLIRQQSFGSFYVGLRELSIRNQRHGLVDRISLYLQQELALLGALARRGTATEIAFHSRGGAAQRLGELGFNMPKIEILETGITLDRLVAKELVVKIPGGRTVGPVNFSVTPGQTLAIIGPNGAGKTTLLRALAGHLKIESGAVSLGEKNITSKSVRERGFVTLFQDPGLLDPLSGRENIGVGQKAGLRRRSTVNVDGAQEALSMSSDVLDTVASALSGGQRQVVAFLRAIAASPRCLLLDEPTASLDMSRKNRFTAVLKEEIAERKLPTVLVSHDMAFLHAVANQILLIDDKGRQIAVGPVEDFADGGRYTLSAELLGATNVFRVKATDEVVDLDGWIELRDVECPLGATGLQLPTASLSVVEGRANVRSSAGAGRTIPGVIVSRRLFSHGEFILFEPAALRNSSRRGRARGLWLEPGQTKDLSSMNVELHVATDLIRWLF